MNKKVYPYELIGQEIEVIDSKNKSDLKIQGKIVDETKQTLKILTNQGKTKTLIKKNFAFKLKSTNQTIEGKSITKRSEERIKGK